MKRSNDHEQFMRWQEYLSMKKGMEELTSAERKQEFQAFMEFESMKNEYYQQQQDSNLSNHYQCLGRILCKARILTVLLL